LSATDSVHAEDIKVSQVPLSKAASQAVSPNLLFILDDSGSMGWDYTPDFVNDSLCRKNNSITDLMACSAGHPPFMSAGFNKQYYNPHIRYTPGLKADGSSYPDMNSGFTSGWTKVWLDGYGANVSGNKKNIISGMLDIKWNGNVNTTYAYPDASNNTSNDTTYNTSPYYYNMKPLYCTTDDGKDCSASKSITYVVEIPYRWCKSGTFTDCQAKKIQHIKSQVLLSQKLVVQPNYDLMLDLLRMQPKTLLPSRLMELNSCRVRPAIPRAIPIIAQI